MKDARIQKLVWAAMFAALCCVATLVVQIPSPMNGYVNLGDAVVLLAGWVLGPLYGAAAAGIGCALADLMAGYAYYVPGTLLIKGAVAMLAGLLFSFYRKKTPLRHAAFGRIVSAIAAEAVMVGGYFFYSALLMGKGAAAALSIPGNLVQALIGIVASTVVMELLMKNPAFARRQLQGKAVNKATL